MLIRKGGMEANSNERFKWMVSKMASKVDKDNDGRNMRNARRNIVLGRNEAPVSRMQSSPNVNA